MTRMLLIGFYIRYGKILSQRFWGLSYSIHVIIHFRSDRYILHRIQIYMNLQPSRFQGNNQIEVIVIGKCVISMKNMELLKCDKV